MKSKIILILQLLAFILIGYSFKVENENYALMGDLFFLGAILLGSTYDDLVTYTLIIPFTGLMPVGFFRLNICVLISVLKLFISGGKINGLLIVSSVYMLLSYIMLNAGSTYMTLLCLMLYCLAAVYILDFSKINYRHFMLLISLIGAITLIITSSSDLTMYVEAQNEQFKLGEEVRDLGGAMGVSLYTSIGFACAFMLQKSEKGVLSIFAALAMLFFLGVGLFALSRTFFSSLAISVILGLAFGSFGILKMAKRERWLLVTAIAIVSIVLYYIFKMVGDDLIAMSDKLEVLFEGGGGSRSRIWLSVINYLFSHPFTFLFGSGTNIYPTMDSARGYAFYGYGAHNLYLDVLMSFGLIGFLLLSLLLKNEVIKLKRISIVDKAHKGIVVFPLSMYFACQLAQGSFRDTTSYIYPIVIVMICYGLAYSRKIEFKNGK